MVTFLNNEPLLVQFKFPLSTFLELSQKITIMVCQCYCKVSTAAVTMESSAIAVSSVSPSILVLTCNHGQKCWHNSRKLMLSNKKKLHWNENIFSICGHRLLPKQCCKTKVSWVFLCPCVGPIPILGLIPGAIIGYEKLHSSCLLYTSDAADE